MPPVPKEHGAVGPFMLQELVDDLPLDSPEAEGVKITCLEAWAQSLYVGTSAHEILHLVSIPATPRPDNEAPKPTYILASRTQAPTASGNHEASYIKQILVLPTISRAMVLSSTGLVSFYTLPEFSPAFPGTKLNGIAYIGGLDINEEERIDVGSPQWDERKLVMALAKNRIRMIRIGEEVRLVKDIPLAGALKAMRRGTISCVATREKYALLDVENMAQMPLFSLTTSSGEDPVPLTPAFVEDVVLPPGSRTESPASGRSSRVSSLATGRERRNSSAATTSRDALAVPSGHTRSVSASGTMSRSASTGSRAPSTLAPPPRKDSPSVSPTRSPDSEATSPQPESPAPPAEGESQGSDTSSKQEAPSGSPPKSPAPAATPAPPPAKTATPPPPSAPLQPHIASPTPNEFLLTTGTRPEDPGVGLFVDMNGEVTRGTISFERYPDQVMIHGKWVVSVVPQVGIDLQKWDESDQSLPGDTELKAQIPFDANVKLKEVLQLDGMVVPDIGRKLRLVHVPLKTEELDEEEYPGDRRKNEEERIIAQRISTVESKLVAFEGTKVWLILPSPLVLRLDSKLPNFSDSNNDGIEARVRTVLDVLDVVNKIEPTTERTFHEVSFIKQKCGLLVLGELLRLSPQQTKDIGPREIIRVEEALLESALDPRFIVALFGPSFREDIVESAQGVWVYQDIRKVYRDLKRSQGTDTGFTRDVLLLLKRYLVSWRSKRGFGSVSDETEVFLTVDSALLRSMLLLDSPAYLSQKGETVVAEGNIRNELYRLVESLEHLPRAAATLESFNRLYVLSILYSAHKMTREVLATWRRILDSDDPNSEFEGGEHRMKAYLLRIKDPSLLSEFGAYLASRNPTLGISLFTDPNSRIKLPPAQIIDLLREHAPAALRPYIEHLVLHDKNSSYANDLISLYLDSLTTVLTSDPSAAERLTLSYTAYRAITPPKPTYRDFLADNSERDSSWWRDRLHLLDLLGGNTDYKATEILAKIQPFDSLLVPEMVILHGRLRAHQPALSLLTHSLADFDTAINYCLFGGLSLYQTHNAITRREEQEMLFNMLLDEFLKLEDVSVRIEQTGELLKRFGGWLDVTHVLEVVPENWSIEILSGFLMGALRRLVREKKESAVARGLWRGREGKVSGEWVARMDETGGMVEEA